MLYQLGPWSLVGLNVLDDGFMFHIMTETRQLFRDSSRKNEEATQVTILMTFTL